MYDLSSSNRFDQFIHNKIFNLSILWIYCLVKIDIIVESEQNDGM